MDKNDIKSMWHKAHNASDEIIFNKVSIEKTITMNHSKVISKTLIRHKIKSLCF